MKYRIERMEELRSRDLEHFIYEFESCVILARSILDILLEDINLKFKLGICCDERLDINILQKIAKHCKNKRLAEFIQWYSKVYDDLKRSDIGNLLFQFRNIAVHRSYRRFVELSMATTVPVGDYAEAVRVPDKEVGAQAALSLAKHSTERGEIKIILKCDDEVMEEFTPESAVQKCRDIVQRLELVVKDALERFWDERR